MGWGYNGRCGIAISNGILSLDMLVTAPVDPNATTLPSPNQLKRKIIIKHKKLIAEGEEEATLDMPASSALPNPTDGSDVASFVMDLSNSIKNGYLLMQDPIDKVCRVCGPR